MRLHRTHVVAAVASAAVVLGACGGGDEPTVSDSDPARTGSAPHSAGGAGPQHTHGLGLRGGTLYIATHSGLRVAPSGQTKAESVGESEQDIMGFSVAGDDRLLGSGHPGPSQQDLPPNLGLIESRDGGASWTTVSLLGEADFHVLESAGSRIYGFDGMQGRLMVSSDSGRSWQQRVPPAAVFALAIDPTDGKRVVAATERGLVASLNAGEAWRPVNQQLAGLLAWPRARQLYLIDGQGRVQVSRDGGREWRVVGSIGAAPAAFIAAGEDLYAAIGDGSVKRSTDGGRSWTVRATS